MISDTSVKPSVYGIGFVDYPEAMSETMRQADAPFKILENEIEVINQGETFLFRIPNSRDEGRFGANLKKLRREVDPEGIGFGEESGWDDSSDMHMRSAAWFMTALIKTSADWVYSPGPDGKPAIDWGKWPARQADRVVQIVIAFLQAVNRFRGPLDSAGSAGEPAGEQALAGGENAGA